MLRICSSLFLLAAALLSTGCATRQLAYDGTTPKAAIMLTEGVRITAVDEDWELVFGTPSTPPRVEDIAKYAMMQSGPNVERWLEGGCFSVAQVNKANFDLDAWSTTIKVLIHVDGIEKPLHGYINFSEVHEGCLEPAAQRYWRVAVPPAQVQAARAGLVQRVYQPYKAIRLKRHGGRATAEYVSWVLTFSSLPF